jgi:hypothetical protein
MFDGFEEWQAKKIAAMRTYAELRRQIEELEAQAAQALEHAIDAYLWPAQFPIPTRYDNYSVEIIEDRAYGEDLTSELALAGKCSHGAAQYLVKHVTTLTEHLPQCWAKVVSAEAPLWQALKVADGTQHIVHQDGWQVVDDMVAPSLGCVGVKRLNRAITAGLGCVNPDWLRHHAATSERCVRTGGNEADPLTGWVWAKVDRADAIYFDAIVQLIADTLQVQ